MAYIIGGSQPDEKDWAGNGSITVVNQTAGMACAWIDGFDETQYLTGILFTNPFSFTAQFRVLMSSSRFINLIPTVGYGPVLEVSASAGPKGYDTMYNQVVLAPNGDPGGTIATGCCFKDFTVLAGHSVRVPLGCDVINTSYHGPCEVFITLLSSVV